VSRILGMFPLSTVLFPGALLPLHVFEPRYRCLVADCLDGQREFGVVLITRGSEVGGGDQRVDLGTLARITRLARLEDGRILVTTQGAHRVAVEEWLPDDPYPRARINDVEDGAAPDEESLRVTASAALSAVRRLRSLLSELGDIPALPHDVGLDLSGDGVGEGERLAWRLCALAPLNLIDRQRLLGCRDPIERLALLHELSAAMADDAAALLAGGSPG
jgi:uncharacterized protein